ncbi:serine hydrolase domain-containing protein [Saccharothrix violaceirubra]|uniref:D-alanyl-D-alanine carboxypeptidase n=1 Tax=Saccharothrix violaceirubra TaxID=413306 RepID=A0A7W7WTM7_9PSEU|nr:serine hydrolase domain-containing protein [Saccharothrix violaceirubra]MBB4963335.1 D-alanyl-D-alanine carboxypeptidase [Saccharothrix violaceirubra]
MRKIVVAVAAIGLAATTTAGTATAAPDRIDRGVVQRALDNMARTGAQGVLLRVSDNGRSFTMRSGTARVDRPGPVPTNASFRVGSVTKTFVSTVVLQLVGEGRVDLDAPVSRYLPGLLPDGDRITVRQILQHTSGLYDYTRELSGDPAERFRHWDEIEPVEVSTSHPLDFQPGEKWAYSNTNYVVAGLLVTAVTGRWWGDEVERRIARPLGLRTTSAPGDRVDLPGPHAHGYTTWQGKTVDVTRLNPSVAGAAGSMVSTTADLDRFIDALLDGKLLKPAQQAELLKLTEVSSAYGLGIIAFGTSCGTIWGHSGGIDGFATLLYSSRDTKTRLALSANIAPEAGNADGWKEAVDEVFC